MIKWFKSLEGHQRNALAFLGLHLLYGTIGGAVFGGLILFFDMGGIGSMIWASPDRITYLFLLFFGLFVTFGSMGMAFGIFSLSQERD